MDTNDCFIKIGWCPEVVRITKLSDGQDNLWTRLMGNDASLSRVAAGDRTANTDKGIKLVLFTDDPLDASEDPSAVDPSEWWKANGIQITSDVAFLADDNIVLVEAWRMQSTWMKITHDGGDNCNTYCQDGSFDFRDAGVNPGDIVYNLTNGNYAFVKSLVKPSGLSKYCRIMLAEDVRGETATASADVDDADVLYVIPRSRAWYPMSDIGLMT